MGTTRHLFIGIVFSFFASFFFNANAQYKIPPKPEKLKEQKGVYDYIKLLSKEENLSLEQKLIRYSDTTSTQIVVAIIKSTEGEQINYLGAQWGQEWGIGQADKDNGILIILAYDDRKIAINTGYGTEHLLTDAISKRIIDREIIPYFKKNDYSGGLNHGVDVIFEVLNGEYQGTRQSSSGEFPFGVFFLLFIFFIIFIIIISKHKNGGGRNGGKRSNGTSILDAIILSNMGRGSYKSGSSGGFGGFGGGSSGGGFSGGFGGGFGGGGFGGGGASGGW